MNFESLDDPRFKLDKSSMGKVLGGYTESSPGGSMTVGSGTPHQTTINYSSDTVRRNDITHEEEGKTLHLCANGDDPNCGGGIT